MSAVVLQMSDTPPMEGDGGAPAAKPGEGATQAAATKARREKRKKTLDSGRVQRLFRDFRYQYGSELAWDVELAMPIKISHLRHTFGNDEVRLWMASERRQVVMPEDVVFDPSQTCGPECVNLFTGLHLSPKAGDCAPVLDLLDHLCDRDETISAWILDWVAYQVQHLGAKLPTAIIMHGDEGSGKNMFWEECVMPLFAPYGSIVGQAELENQYNDWLSKRLFIIGDEVISQQEKRHLKGKMKALISGKWVQIQAKFLPVRQEANHVNLVLLSNELQPAALDASDRRNLVVWTPPKREQDYYAKVRDHLRSGGLQAFMAFLLARDLSGFNPYAPPPDTKAKADLIDLGRPNPERFWLAWKGGEVGAPCHTCSADQAYRLYRRWCMSEGEKYPMSKPVFGRMVGRVAKEGLQVKVAKLGAARTARMWLMAPAPDGDFGVFAQESINAFEAYLGSNGDDN